jgi:hypothetical protein
MACFTGNPPRLVDDVAVDQALEAQVAERSVGSETG